MGGAGSKAFANQDHADMSAIWRAVVPGVAGAYTLRVEYVLKDEFLPH